MRLSVLAGLLVPVLVGAEPAKLPRTPPSTWSTQGYQQFRFGMGPGDVQEALSNPSAVVHSMRTMSYMRSNSIEGQGLVDDLVVRLAGDDLRVTFSFQKDRLHTVGLFGFGAQMKTYEKGSSWFSTVSQALSVKYGKPARCEVQRCEWRRGDLRIILNGGWHVLTFSSERGEREMDAALNEMRRDEEQSKVQTEVEKL